MRLLKGLNAKWTAGLTATLLLSVFSLPVSAVGMKEGCGEGETRCASAEWGRLAQGQITEERCAESMRLNQEGLQLSNRGQFREALEKFQQALAIVREIGERRGEGAIINNLGEVYRRLGQYPKAIEYYQQALSIIQEVGALAGGGTTLNNLGQVYRNLGQYPKAIEYYQQALAIHQEGGALAGEGVTLTGLGAVYDSLGQYPRAIEYYQQALTIHKEVGNRLREGTTLSNLGGVYLSLGQYPKTLEYYQQALAIHQEVGDLAGEGTTLNNLGEVYRNLGQYPKALEYYQQSLAITQEVGDLAGEGTTLNNLGLVYLSLGQYPKALEYYQQALTIHKEVGNRLMEGTTLNNLGAVYDKLGQYKEAIEYYQQSLAIRQEVGDLAGEGVTLNNLGAVYFINKHYAEAEQNLYAAIAVWESLRSSELADADKISLFETQADTYYWLQHTLIAQNETNTALEISERGRARAFVELLTRQLNPQSNELPKVDPPSIEEIKQIAKTQNATLVQYSLIPNTSLYIWVISPTGQIDFRSIDLNNLDSSLADFLSPNQLSESDRLAVVGLRGASEPDRQLTSFIRGTQESLRFPLGVGPAEDTVSSAQRLQNLHQLLIQPIADLLPTTPEDRVIFIPHQSLFYVPFPALQDGEEYLIEKHTILTAPSIQVLNLTHQHRERIGGRGAMLAPKESLIVGNPTMPRIRDQDGDLVQLSNLSGAENEAIEIAQMLGVEPLLGAKATETAVSQRMKTARLIHFATHGLLDDFGYGIPGAIALAPSGNNDGLLTSGEIVTLTQNNPLNAELVVLSACDTGLGDLSGDGMVGLSRSLIAAGVPSIVVSLWKVPDAATKALMTDFYTNLYDKKMDKAQALRQAMLSAIEGNYPDPQAWAAFTLIGEAED